MSPFSDPIYSGLDIPQNANVIKVTTNFDETNPLNRTFSLREAIALANSTIEDDVILLDRATYEMSIPGINEDNNAGGDFDILGKSGAIYLVPDGTISGPTTIDANGIDRVFHVLGGGEVFLKDILITGGIADLGAGIHNQGTLELVGNTKIKENNSNLQGGGLYNDTEALATLKDTSSILLNTAGRGGGIYNNGGRVKLTRNSKISRNDAGLGGGGIWNDNAGEARLNFNSKISGNTGGTAGGGVYNFNESTLILNGDSKISSNTAVDITKLFPTNGGGVFNWNSTIILNDNSSINGNITDDSGGGIYSLGGAIELKNSSSIYNNEALYGGGIANLGDSSVATIVMEDNSLVSSNTAFGPGGGIYNLGHDETASLSVNGSSAIDGNRSQNGGGIYNSSRDGDASVVIQDQGQVTNNRASYLGVGNGGGIFMDEFFSFNSSVNSTLDVLGTSSISGNTAKDKGGGVYAFDLQNQSLGNTSFHLTDSATIADNRAANGGGAYMVNAKFLMDRFGRISGNYSSGAGGGVHYTDGSAGSFTMADNSFIGSNTAGTDGGGIMALGFVTVIGTSRISSNSALSEGGGIHVAIGGISMSFFSRISNNSAGYQGGGILGYDGFTVLQFVREGVNVLNNTPENILLL